MPGIGAVNRVAKYKARLRPWRNFSREVFRVQRNLGGYALRQEVALLVAKYVARKCLESVLVNIRNDVFGIEGPPPE